MMDVLFPTWKKWTTPITHPEIVATLKHRIEQHTSGAWSATMEDCKLVLARLSETRTTIEAEADADRRRETARDLARVRAEARLAADQLTEQREQGWISRAGLAELERYENDPSRTEQIVSAAYDERTGTARRRETAPAPDAPLETPAQPAQVDAAPDAPLAALV